MTTTPYRMDWLLYGLTRSELSRQRRDLTMKCLISFALINLKLTLRFAQIIFSVFIIVSLWLRTMIAVINLRLTNNGHKMDARLIGLRRRIIINRQAISSRRACSAGAFRKWVHTVIFEWRSRIHFFCMMQQAFRRRLHTQQDIGRHSAPAKLEIPVQRYAALSVLLVIVFGVVMPSFTSKSVGSTPSLINQNEQKDLAVPAWASSVEPWKNLVRQVSHNSNVVIVRNSTQTNILSETVSTVNNTGQTVNQRYTPGQERLLYLLILVGSNGDASHKNGLCPLGPTQRRQILSQIQAAGHTIGSNVDGKDGAENSLTFCGYLVNSIADQLVNQNPNGQQRYAQHGTAQLAYDLAYNWVGGNAKSKKAYAATFARLYADWNKPASPTYAKLRKE